VHCELYEALCDKDLILTGEPMSTDSAKHWCPLSALAKAKKQESGRKESLQSIQSQIDFFAL
jgi:hypothetical protein